MDPVEQQRVELNGAVGSPPDYRSRGHEFDPQVGHITFVDIDPEIISTSILLLPQIQEGCLSCNSMCPSIG